MTKPTEGPYEVEGEDLAAGDIPFIEIMRGEAGTPSYKSICHVQSTLEGEDFVLTDEDWANARLLAKSWEMREALRKAELSLMPNVQGGTIDRENVLTEIRALLRSIEGE